METKEERFTYDQLNIHMLRRYEEAAKKER
jgi:hypothetical protein